MASRRVLPVLAVLLAVLAVVDLLLAIVRAHSAEYGWAALSSGLTVVCAYHAWRWWPRRSRWPRRLCITGRCDAPVCPLCGNDATGGGP